MSEACPIWNTPAKIVERDSDAWTYDSPRAGGRFYIVGTARGMLQNDPPSIDRKVAITNWLVRQRVAGNDVPILNSSTLKDAYSPRRLPMSERKRRFFLSLEAHGYEPGDTVKLGGGGWSPDDETLMDKMCAWLGVKDDKQRQKILETFASEGLLKIDTKHRLTIQPKGYEFLDSLVEVGGSGSQAFVAMWFDDSMSLAFDEGFKPAIENAGFDALRIDRKEHNNKIDDEIVGEIRRSRFVVADFTTRTEGEGSGARGGVYFEAGFAMGLGLPVIWTCREDCIGFVHFDTRQYSHVVWQEPSDLAEKLRKRILAVVGEGPEVLN